MSPKPDLCFIDLSSYPGYFLEPHWLSMVLPIISRVTLTSMGLCTAAIEVWCVISCYVELCSNGTWLRWGYWTNFHHSLIILFLFTKLMKYSLPVTYHIHIWQVSPQLSCGGTCQIWMWLKGFNGCFAQRDMSLVEKLKNTATVASTPLD